jgi:hypothetical protein
MATITKGGQPPSGGAPKRLCRAVAADDHTDSPRRTDTQADTEGLTLNSAAADLAAARQALRERWLEKRAGLTAAMAREARAIREDQSRIELIAEIYGLDDPEVLAHQERASRSAASDT